MSIQREIKHGTFYAVIPRGETDLIILPAEDFTRTEDYDGSGPPIEGYIGRNLNPESPWVAGENPREVLTQLREEFDPIEQTFEDLKGKFGYVILVHEDGSIETWRDFAIFRPSYSQLRSWVQDLITSVDFYLTTEERAEAFAGDNSYAFKCAPNPAGSRLVNWPVDRGPILGRVVILVGFASHDEIDRMEEKGLLDFQQAGNLEKVPNSEVPYPM